MAIRLAKAMARYCRQAENSSLIGEIARGPDGLKQDTAGNLYVAGGTSKSKPPFEPDNAKQGGIYVFGPMANFASFSSYLRTRSLNCAFGGEDLKTLFYYRRWHTVQCSYQNTRLCPLATRSQQAIMQREQCIPYRGRMHGFQFIRRVYH